MQITLKFTRTIIPPKTSFYMNLRILNFEVLFPSFKNKKEKQIYLKVCSSLLLF
jgi:agmatine/peptidylarginine deiminase